MSNCCDIVIEVPEEVIVIEMTPEGADGKSLNPRGTWDSSAVYAYRDMVAYQGNSYIALKNVPAGTLPTDTEYWMINAAGGNTTYWGNIHGTLSNQTDLVTALASKADANAVYTKTEADALLSNKADADSVYTKTETDTLLAEKANSGDVYTKTATDNLLAEKADANSVYTKTQVNDALDLKANKADVYTQTELDGIFDGIDNALDTKADKTDVYTKAQTYSKTEVDNALSTKANSADVYTKTETDDLLSAKADTADLGALAEKDTVDYETEVTNKPTLGTMSAESADDYYEKTETDSLLSAKANSADLGTMSAESVSDYYDKDEVEDLINASGVTAELDASGSIATFETRLAENLSKLSVQIEPVQDLHGYDAPWSAGGGKNVLSYPYESISREVNGVTISANADGSVTASGTYTGTEPVNFFLKANGAGSGLPAGTYIFSNDADRGNDKICCVAGSSGSDFSYANVDISTPFTFTLAHDNDTIGYCLVQVLVGFTGTFTIHPMIRLASITDDTWQPYSNICPISGHSSAVVTRTGRNILDVSDATASVSTLTYTLTDDGGIHVSGTNSAGVYNIIDSNMPFKQLTEYTVSGTTATSRLRLRLYNSNNTVLRELYFGDGGGTFTPTVEEVKCDVTLISSASTWNDTFYFMIRLSSDTDSTFAKYTGTSVTISLGDTRYGGVLDAVNGILTVTHASITYSGGNNESWEYENNEHFMRQINDMAQGDGQNGLTNWLPTKTNKASFGALFGSNNRILYCTRITSTLGISSVDGWKSYLSSNPLQAYYPLNTPVVVSLTPAQVQALAGKNYVWASTGDVALSYYDSNTEEAINDTKQMIADMTDQMVAPKNLTANEFIVVNKHLYKVTANVASGSALVIGTNVVETTIAEQLTYLLSQI